MNRLIFDFNIINSDEKLVNFLEKELELNRYINGKWGRNLDAFWDLYSFSDAEDYFGLRNYHNIKDNSYKKYIDAFIFLLDQLSGYVDNGKKIVPNPNFHYKIID